jgi:hypothetical protein
VLKAAGRALIFDGKGHDVVDWGFALKNIRASTMTLIKLPGKSLYEGGDYLGEGLDPSADDFFAAVAEDRLPNFLFEHPEYFAKNA